MKIKTYFILLVGLFLLPLVSQAQISGQNPLMVTNKNNGFVPVTGKLPVLMGDTLAKFQMRGWVEDGFYHPGVQIQSYITGPVTPFGFPADMMFSTGFPSLESRMVITAGGRVGIGTNTPDFDLHTVGNTHTSGDFYGRIHFDVNGDLNAAPDTYIDEAYFERHRRTGLTPDIPEGSSTDGGLLSLAPGGDSDDHQLFFGDEGIFHRQEAGNAGNWTNDWHRLLTENDISGTPNRIAKFTGEHQIGDSQLFDDGNRVGIRTLSPSLSFDVDINGDTRIAGQANITNDLDVNGSANVDANLDVEMNTDIGGNLDVVGNGYFNGEVSIGTLLRPDDLDGGATNINHYNLYVEGGILTEEVRVRAGWADYVFEEDYALLSLEEVEEHIQEKGYLPNTPSAQTVGSQGLELGDCAVNQQEKIEELFLHLIEMNKRLNQLEVENQKLQQQLNQVENK